MYLNWGLVTSSIGCGNVRNVGSGLGSLSFVTWGSYQMIFYTRYNRGIIKINLWLGGWDMGVVYMLAGGGFGLGFWWRLEIVFYLFYF